MTHTYRYYFAYGSNMDHSQMAKRCPQAYFVSKASLPGYTGVVDNRGYAPIIPSKNSTFPFEGVLWKISELDEKELDRYEGVERNTYRKELMRVHVDEGHVVEALVYISNHERAETSHLTDYLKKVHEAAIDNGLNDETVQIWAIIRERSQ